jgi:hypothetical protein
MFSASESSSGQIGQLYCALTMLGAASKPAPRPKVVRRVVVFFMVDPPVSSQSYNAFSALWQGLYQA